MLKVGITGNIGSGKSTVSKIFELLGVPVFYSDAAAREVMTADGELVSGLKAQFGEDAYLPDGSLNRKFIASKVFTDTVALNKLNALVHPAVFRSFDNWANNHKQADYVIKEAAILFESGSYKLCDYSIIVTCPFNLRMERITHRDQISMEEAINRDNRQMPEDDKIKLANLRISNDDTQLVIPQVLALHEQLKNISQGK